ncbi:hypothetical protein [Daejeonella sp. JGW-45]|uniref:hypothetical protein n=1 Tax=Daejeonella sp. JGW-45 TaxID=3034148 RepID=UPI0023ED2F45|nr:hypothetical protein [Daejeonella sp. JGW-45]
MNTSERPALDLYKLVVVHYLVSALCFVGLAVMLMITAGNLTGHYFHPQILAVTHMAALGWGTLIVFGAIYQLLPVILETELYSYKLGWLSLGLFIPGLTLLVCSFWHFQPGLLMQCGSILLLSGITLFGLNVFLTAKQNRDDIHQEFIITACIWLMATALLGALLVFNFRYAFLQKDHLLFLKLHAHMGLAGWFLILITGVSSKLIPMFLVSKVQKNSLLTWSYYLMNAGLLLFITDTYFFGLNLKSYVAAVIVFAGIVCWMLFLSRCFRSRIRKTIDLPMSHSVLSFVMLGAAIIILPVIIFNAVKADQKAVDYTTLYGTLLLMGWISSLILGQTFKTLPYIVWTRHYQHLTGSAITPMPADLFNHKILRAQFILFLFFTVMFYAGLFYKSVVWIVAGLVCIFMVAILYFINVIAVLLHSPSIKK